MWGTRAVNRMVKAIKEARRPVIFAGGGVIRSGAAAELRELAIKCRIPVTLSLMSLGAFPGDNPLFLGMPGMHGMVAANFALTEADLIIALGARFDDRVTGKLEQFASEAKIIHVDIDPAEIGKNVPIDIPIVGDVKQVIRELLKRVQPGDTSDWLQRIEEWQARYPLSEGTAPSSGKLKPQFVIREINRLTGGKALITTDVGQHQMWVAQHYCFREPRTFLTSGGLGTMGYGFPAAIGAKLASPASTVICIAGDGSIQMNIQELATVVCGNYDLKVVVLNNGCLGMVRQWQELFFEKRYSQSLLHGNPDFARVAEAFGATGLRVSTADEATAALEKALSVRGPVVIDCLIDPAENVYPMVAPNRPINEIITGRDLE